MLQLGGAAQLVGIYMQPSDLVCSNTYIPTIYRHLCLLCLSNKACRVWWTSPTLLVYHQIGQSSKFHII